MATKEQTALTNYYKAQMNAKNTSNKVLAVTYSDEHMKDGYLIGDAYSLFRVGVWVREKLPILHTATDVPQKMTKSGPEPWSGSPISEMFVRWSAEKGKVLKLTKAIMEVGSNGDCRVFVDADGKQILARRDLLSIERDTYDDLVLWNRFEQLASGAIKIVCTDSKGADSWVVGFVMPLFGNRETDNIDFTPPEATPATAEEVA